jgi:hypothetical protein
MNNPFNFFDKIYCINLKERTDRWENCLKNFEKYEISNYERIDAIKINGDLPSKRKGQIGCSLSFAKCFDKIINEKINKVLIFEDDFEFKLEKKELFEKLNKSIFDLPDDWDSIYFGGTVISDYGYLPLQKYTTNLYKLQSAHCLHSTGFSLNGVKKIINLFKNTQNWHIDLINNYENMDVFLAKEYHHKTKSFITTELLCYQKINLSNIEDNTYDYSEWMNRNFNYFKNLI